MASANGADPDMTAWDDAVAAGRAALAQPEGEGPTDGEIEEAAKLIHASMRFAVPDNHYTRDWVERGNSLMQDEARRTARAILAHWGHPTAPPVPEAGEVGELVAALRRLERRAMDEGSDNGDRLSEAVELDRIATLLQQPSAPAPAVVPVAMRERLPDRRPESEGGDCDMEGRCWLFEPRSATPFPNWTLLWRGHMGPCNSHWLPASAIPAPSNYIRDQKYIRPDSRSLPQAGEGEA